MSSEVIRKKSFFLVVFSFVFFMVMLIISGDWFVLIVGWDWLGVSSFFLVCFYFRENGWVGSLKTYFVNRLGDGFFLFILSFFLFNFFFDSFPLTKFFVFMVILLCQTKRAQVPFSSWLPAAMSAPTPVSALVHSSTLVTAGVYILIRCGPLLIFFLPYIQFIGLLTLFLGSFCACGSFDAKKIVAFSTLSHLGYMFLGLSRGIFNLAFFHLIVHASFKALMFICVGMLICEKKHSQDFRHMGVSFSNLFFIWLITLRGFRLMGFPFFSGFFSKDFLLESFFWVVNIFFLIFFYSSLLFSFFYTFRLVFSLLKVNWLTSSLGLSKNTFWYLLILRSFSVFCGKFFSYKISIFLVIPRDFIFKFFVYFFIFLGVFFLKKKFFEYFSLRINSLDSFSTFLKNKISSIIVFSSFVDQGVLKYYREFPVFKKIFSFSWVFSKKIFYFFWLFFFLIFFW